MKIVYINEDIFVTPKPVAHIVDEQTGACRILGVVAVLQKIISRKSECVLYTFPEDREAVRVDADPHDLRIVILLCPVEIPVDGSGLAVACRVVSVRAISGADLMFDQ